MGTNIINAITSAKTIIGIIAIILSGFVYSFDSLHYKFITIESLNDRLNRNGIIGLQNKIIDLQINQGYARSENELKRLETLIKVKESQILKYREH